MNKGRANATINSLSLYRGSATGKFVLDGSGSTSFIGGNLALKDVLTGALLRDFAGFEKLAGKGTLSGDFTMRGNSTKALKSSLSGRTKVKLVKGRIEGFDLARYVSQLTGNSVPGAGASDKPMTPYDEMSGVLDINKGVARNRNFLLTGKFFRVRAAGIIDLVKETLRLRVAPRLFSGDWSFAPPLKVKGPWSKPRVSFDALAFLGGGESNNGIIVRSLGNLLSGKKIDLNSLLKNRGLQTDEEIESYLAGKKIDTSHDQPANDNAPAQSTSENDGTGTSGSPLGGLLGGGGQNNSSDLLKKIFP